MPFSQPRRWRCLERHPLGAEYPDLPPPARERMAESVRKYGVLNQRRITLHEGMVLDGWQLYQACLDANVKPVFQGVPRGVPPEDYVEIVNDTRRHETAEVALARAVKRREKVLELKAEGKSSREIAEEVGASQTTVQRDIAKSEPGGSVETNGVANTGDGFKLTAPYNIRLWEPAYLAVIRQITALASSYGLPEDSDVVYRLNRRAKELGDAFVKLHQQLSKKRKG